MQCALEPHALPDGYLLNTCCPHVVAFTRPHSPLLSSPPLFLPIFHLVRCRETSTNEQLVITRFRVSLHLAAFLNPLTNVLVLRVSGLGPADKGLYVEVEVKGTIQRTQVIHDESVPWNETLPM